MRRTGCIVVAVVGGLLLFSSRFAAAQPSVERFQRQLDQIQRDTLLQVNQNIPVGKRTVFDYGGALSFNYLSIDSLNNDNHGLRQVDAVGYARLSLDGVHEVFARGRATYDGWNPGDSFDGEGSRLITNLEVAYYRFDLRRALAAYDGVKVDYDVNILGGRQLVYWGNGLTISEYLDGGIFTLTWHDIDLQAIAGVTPVRTVDFDTSRPSFDDHTRRGFYGALLSARLGDHRPFLYALWQRDYNHRDVLNTPLGGGSSITTHFGYDSVYFGAGSTGALTDHLAYSGEFVYEGGQGLSNSFSSTGGAISPIKQQYKDISAYAGDLRLDYLPGDMRRSKISGEIIFASGDDDRGNTSNTFAGNQSGRDRAFNAFGLVNTGLAFAPKVSNLWVYRLGASTFPFHDYRPLRDLQIGADFFLFQKFAAAAPIDEPTTRGTYLGWEPDVFLNWRLASDITLAFRYGAFMPSSHVISNDTRQFFFGGITFAF
jgi:hypothetical protein